jgi:hypothetical protein
MNRDPPYLQDQGGITIQDHELLLLGPLYQGA